MSTVSQGPRNGPPLVTIVMPSFNHGSFIREALDSILKQDYPAIECLVIDGGSSDTTLDTLRSYGDHVRWVSEPDGGLYEAVNKGWRMASGEWLGWLNCDDRLLPGSTARLVRAAVDRDPQADFVYGDYYRFNAHGEILEVMSCGEPDARALLRYGNRVFTGAGLVRRDLAERLGYFDLRYSLSADYAFIVRALQTGRALHIAEPTAMFRIHDDSKSQSQRVRMWEEALAISEELSGKRYLPQRLRYAADRFLHRIASDRLVEGRRFRAVRRTLRRAWPQP